MNEAVTGTSSEHARPLKNYLAYVMVLFSTTALVVLLGLYIFSQPPSNVPYPIELRVEPGMSVRSLAALAKEQQLVRSELLLYTILTALNDPTSIHAGTYRFDGPMSVVRVATKIASNDVEATLVSLTIPEGVTAARIAQIASSVLTNFDAETFIALTQGDEGYLFPETYFVPESFTPEELRALMKQTFDQKMEVLQKELATSTPKQVADLVILASIIEREANDAASMGMVSGILQNRLTLGMPLQADAAIEYVLDTPLNALKPGELAGYLKELDSPYNTYRYTGLPPTPIGNPGAMALSAALNPTASDFFYYITDEEGNFYYAKTLTEHNHNIATYLR